MIAENFIKAEIAIDQIYYRGIPLGGLFSKLFFVTHRKDPRIEGFKSKIIFPKIIIKSIINHFRKKKEFKKVVLGYNTTRSNFKNLIFPLSEYLESGFTFYSPESYENFNFIKFNEFPNLGLIQCVRIYVKTRKIAKEVFKIIESFHLPISKTSCFNHLYVQLLTIESILPSLARTKLVIVDYDRTFAMSAVVLAAKSKGIKTVTLIHSTINTVYGYHPFLAEYIWCWGEIQKKQLQSMGLDENRISIVGNPVVEVERPFLRNKNAQINIGVVLDRHNYNFISFLNSLMADCKRSSFHFMFKKHPMSLNTEFDEKDLHFSNFEVFPSNLTNKDFLEKCDIIITKGSTMSYEAPMNNKPVLLLDLDEGADMHRNIEMMKNELYMPVFKSVPLFYSYLIELENLKFREELASCQQKALRKKLYFKTGKNSSKFTAEKIKSFVK